MLVFGLSSRCNLKCLYCNANAGPDGERPTLDPRLVEKWVGAFASVDPAYMAVQLHGGEPLIVDPPVEAYAAIVRNALARFPNTALGYLGFQSNGSALTARRASELEAVGLTVDISIDGPASIHDRQRLSRGRSNHLEAVRAHSLLRARGKRPGVISVSADPDHVLPTVEYFVDNGFTEVRMNVIRPEGRAARIRRPDEGAFMREMAVRYLEAAKVISAHNRRNPDAPFYEYNLMSLMKILLGEEREADMIYWSFLVDDRGRLWSHPCGFYGEGVRLTDGEEPDSALVRRALGLEGLPAISRSTVADALRQRLAKNAFSSCANCASPGFCVPVYGRRAETEQDNPVCIWTSNLMSHLADWLSEDPESARRLVPRIPQAHAPTNPPAMVT